MTTGTKKKKKPNLRSHQFYIQTIDDIINFIGDIVNLVDDIINWYFFILKKVQTTDS